MRVARLGFTVLCRCPVRVLFVAFASLYIFASHLLVLSLVSLLFAVRSSSPTFFSQYTLHRYKLQEMTSCRAWICWPKFSSASTATRGANEGTAGCHKGRRTNAYARLAPDAGQSPTSKSGEVGKREC